MQQSSGVRVLFTGQYWAGANSMFIARAFQNNGAVVHIVNDTHIFPGWRSSAGRALRRLSHPLIEREWNSQVLEQVKLFKPDLVYVTSADLCYPETVSTIKALGIPVMCFFHDVWWKNLRGSNFEVCLPLFDLVATTRHWHVEEFKAAGAAETMVVRFGYDSDSHFPIQSSQADKDYYGADASFIGTNELHRRNELTKLLSNGVPYSFKLWGGLWDSLPEESPLLRYWQGRAVYSREIPLIYATTEVALHWVGWDPDSSNEAMRKGDQHNSRTFQIAACGGAMMLAQRTPEHELFFKENEESIFFTDAEELKEKLEYWLAPAQASQRKAIAKAARQRCLDEDYSYIPVARRFLEYFNLPAISVAEKKLL